MAVNDPLKDDKKRPRLTPPRFTVGSKSSKPANDSKKDSGPRYTVASRTGSPSAKSQSDQGSRYTIGEPKKTEPKQAKLTSPDQAKQKDEQPGVMAGLERGRLRGRQTNVATGGGREMFPSLKDAPKTDSGALDIGKLAEKGVGLPIQDEQRQKEEVLAAQEKLDKIPMHRAITSATEAADEADTTLGGIGAYLKALHDDPDTLGAIMSFAAEQAPVAANTIVGTKGAGAIAKGTSKIAQSARVGMGSAFGSVAATYGPNVAEGLQRGMSYDDAEARAAIRSAVQGIVDGTAGAVVPIKIGPNQWTNVPSQALAQVAAGAGGEYAASKAVGDEVSRGEIITEGLGELIGAPGDVAAAVMDSRAQRGRQDGEGEAAPDTRLTPPQAPTLTRPESAAAGADTSALREQQARLAPGQAVQYSTDDGQVRDARIANAEPDEKGRIQVETAEGVELVPQERLSAPSPPGSLSKAAKGLTPPPQVQAAQQLAEQVQQQETSDASRIRQDEGAVRGTGDARVRGQDQGRQDLEQGQPGQPRGTELRGEDGQAQPQERPAQGQETQAEVTPDTAPDVPRVEGEFDPAAELQQSLGQEPTAETRPAAEPRPESTEARPAPQTDPQAKRVEIKGRPAYETYRKPDELQTDAETYQYKSEADREGVTDRLEGVKQWNPMAAGRVVVHRRSDGSEFVADGHQRLALAKRMQAQGQDIDVPVVVVDEQEGWSPQEVRSEAALKNIGEGTGSALDAAKVLREAGEEGAARIEETLPPNSALVRQARGLSSLNDTAFQAVVNEQVEPQHAAVVGEEVTDPAKQNAALQYFQDNPPKNLDQARFMARDIAGLEAGGAESAQQGTLGGLDDVADLPLKERAGILDSAVKMARKDKSIFAGLQRNRERIQQEGNQLADDTNESIAQQAAQVEDFFTRQITTDTELNGTLNTLAGQVKSGTVTRQQAVSQLLDAAQTRLGAQGASRSRTDGPRPEGEGRGEEGGERQDLAGEVPVEEQRREDTRRAAERPPPDEEPPPDAGGEGDIFNRNPSEPLFSRAPAEDTPAFRRWFGDSKVVEPDGSPKVVYHGTTADFDSFSDARTNVEADFGRGFYFTSEQADVGTNYAGLGPDLTNKVERTAERLEVEEDLDPDVALERAREQFMANEGAVMPVYLKIENPAVVGGENETTLEMEIVENEEGDLIDERGGLVDFIVNLRDIAAQYDDGDVGPAIDNLLEQAGYESISLSDAITTLKETEEFSYFTDENGDIASSEIIRETLESMGFDGIVDHTVDEKFGSQRRIGQPMEGMDPDTVHYVAFKPTQVKSAIGNRGTYDPRDPNILHSRSPDALRTAARQAAADIREAYPDVTLQLGARPSDGVWTLDNITVPEAQREQGVGTEIMQRIVDAADQAGARIALTPTSDFGASKGRLTDFYERFGFQENTDQAISETMVREPESLRSRADRQTEPLSTPDTLRSTLAPKFRKGVLENLEESGWLEIVPTEADLPSHLQDTRGGIRGVHDRSTGKNYLVAENISTEQAEGVLLHEIGVHYGLRGLLGKKKYNQAIRDVQRLVREGNPRAVAARERVPEGTPEADVAEETLAYLVENEAARKMSVVKRVITAIRAFMQRMGWKGRLTPETLASLARAAVNQSARGITVNRIPPAEPASILRSADGSAPPALADTFYSAMYETLADKLPNKGPADQMLNQIRSLAKKGQFKQEELEWSGIEQWLSDRKGRVTKDELLEALAEMNVKVDVVVAGDTNRINRDSKYAIPEVLRIVEEHQGEADDALLLTLENDGDAYRALMSRFPELEGNEDWAEVVAADVAGGFGNAVDTRFSQWQLPGGEGYREMAIVVPGQQFYRVPDAHAMGGAADINRIAHVRFNIRTDGEGRSVLFIEEIQSDLHQTGRKKGYRSDARMDELERRREEVVEQRATETDTEAYRRLHEEEMALMDEINQLHEAVPDAPFKNTWPLLATKRMIRWAAENNIDRIAWTTGEQQAARYDLSKQVDAVRWSWNEDGRYTLSVDIPGDPMNGVEGGTEPVASDISAEKVEEYIGKDAAGKIVVSADNSGVLQGDDLKVGGAGMRAFYDNILPKTINKYIKRWGAKAQPTKVQGEVNEYQITEEGDIAPQGLDAWGFDVTPDMRKAALVIGQPLYSRVSPGVLSRVQLDEKARPLYSVRADAATAAWGAGAGNVVPTQPTMWEDGFDTPTESYSNLLRYKMQDRYIDLRKIQDSLVERQGPLPDDMNAYVKEELYHGRLQARVDEFYDEKMTPIIKQAEAAEMSMDEAGDFILARHAKERNAQIAKINPEKPDGGSGMTDAEADAILERHADNAEAQNLGEMWDALTQHHRNLLIESGLEKAETVKLWEETYDHYAPAVSAPQGRRPLFGKGKGFDVRGSQKRATGRSTKPENPMIAMMAQYQTTLERAEKAEVGRALMRFIQANPNPDLWEINKPELKPVISRATGLVEYRADPTARKQENVLAVKVDGDTQFITFNENSDTAMRIARSMKNLGAADSGIMLRAMHRLNRTLAALNTSWNPEFVLSNFFRDIQTAGVNISATDARGIGWRMVRDTPKALNGMRSALFGEGTGKWGEYANEFRKEGGMTGWNDAYNDIDRARKKLTNEIADLQRTGADPRKMLRSLGDLVTKGNDVVENGVRLSAYVHAREMGLSKQKAASLAKNLTVNFNRRGDAGQVMNSLYLFYNASVQGMFIMGRALKTKRARRISYGIIGAAAILDMMNRALGGEDDDGEAYYDKVPSYIKERHLVVMLPEMFQPDASSVVGEVENRRYIKIPLPYGYNVFHVAGQVAGEAMTKPDFEAGEAMARAAGSVVGAFNPLGSDASITQFVSPTITDVAVQVSENQDWAGRPVAPEPNPFERAQEPRSQQYWSTTTGSAKWIAENINQLTGGNEVRPGKVDLSPAVLDHITQFFGGGLGRFMFQSVPETTQAVLSEDKELEPYRIPFLRKVYGEVGGWESRQDFYDNLTEIAYAEKEIKAARKAGNAQRQRELEQRYRPYLRYRQRAKQVEKRVRSLKKAMDRLETYDLPEDEYQAERERLETEISATMNRFNSTIGRARRGE